MQAGEILFFIFIFQSLPFSVLCGLSENCSEKISRFALNNPKYSINIPTTETEMKKICLERSNVSRSWGENSPDENLLFKTALYGFFTLQKDICNNESLQTEMIKSRSCLESVSFEKCLSSFSEDFEYNSMEICSNLRKLVECQSELIRENCGKFYSLFEKLVNELTGPLIFVYCGALV
ncbi:uncharacterized protein [Centruroides vittatus]|uniref:uncharacterized protein n=1 Tax=Centruroides vittatus TaxID=120091 RepID=UPI0035102A8B